MFAYAALDNDDGGNHLRTLKLFESRGLLSAGFSLWKPDFEGHNFSLHEPALAATNLAQSSGMDVQFTAEELQTYMQEHNGPVGTAMARLASRKQAYLDKAQSGAELWQRW